MKTQVHSKTFRESDYPLADHRMNRRAVLPAAAYLEMGRALVAHAITASGAAQPRLIVLERVRFEQPFLVVGSAQLEVLLEGTETGTCELSFRSFDDGREVVHARMRGRGDGGALSAASSSPWVSQQTFSQSQVYLRFNAAGMQYGQGFQSLWQAEVGAAAASGALRLPGHLQADAERYGLHPSLIDGALQLCALWHLAASSSQSPMVPSGIDTVRIAAPLRGEANVAARWTGSDTAARFDLVITDLTGGTILVAEGVQGVGVGWPSQRVAPTENSKPDGEAENADQGVLVYSVVQRKAEQAGAASRGASSLILACEDDAEASAFLAAWQETQAGSAPAVRVSCSLDDLAASPKWQQLLEDAKGPLSVALCLPGCNPAGQSADSVTLQLQAVFRVLQSLLSQPDGRRLHLLVASDFDGATDAGHAVPVALAAMLRVLAEEHADLSATVLSVERGTAGHLGRVAADEAVDTRSSVTRVVRDAQGRHEDAVVDEIDGRAPQQQLDSAKTALVTGGLGAIGRHVVDHLLSRQCHSVAIIGRTDVAEALKEIAGRWPQHVHAISYRSADVADLAGMQDAVTSLVQERGAIGAVFHCAGIVEDGLFVRKRWADFAAVLRPKVLGVECLDEATRDQPISHFVLFSSISSLFGNPGQSDYALANGYLDAYAGHRNGLTRRAMRSGHCLSIHWGLWREGGMQVPDSVERWLWETTGMRALQTGEALRALDTVLGSGGERHVVVAGAAPRVRKFFNIALPKHAKTEPTPPSGGVTAAAAALIDATQAWVVQVVANALKVDPATLPPQSSLEALGFDSFLVIQASRQFEKRLGRVSKALFYEAKTLQHLAVLLVERYQPALEQLLGKPVEAPAAAPAVAAAPTPEPPPAPAQPVLVPLPAALAAPLIAEVRSLSAASPAFAGWLSALLRRCADESALAAAREDIAPFAFVADRAGVFFFNANLDTWLVFSYCGEQDAFPAALGVLTRFAEERQISLQLLLDARHASTARAAGYSTTRIGVMQVLPDISGFTLAGGSMRRLRYLDEKIRKAGDVQLVELRAPLAGAQRDAVLGLVDAWCATKKRVNPYVLRVREELTRGALDARHRLFACLLDGVMINAIVVTEMPSRSGYLMDLEFYAGDMPLGGLDCSIAAIVALLKAEGVRYFSLGATFGTQLDECEGTDPDALFALQELHRAGALNNDGNFQFKNKFRTENEAIQICRNPGADAASIGDALMLLGDPGVGSLAKGLLCDAGALDRFISGSGAPPLAVAPAASAPAAPPELDFRTDSWGEIDQDYVSEYTRGLNPSQAASVEDSLRRWFPFEHIVLAAQGRQAEGLFYKALAAMPPGPGAVVQNMLFPTQVYHQLDGGFEAAEIEPAPPRAPAGSASVFTAEFDPARFDAASGDRKPVLVMFEVACNAEGGRATRLSCLRALRAWCDTRRVPLFLDATRIIDNAVLIQRHEPGQAGRAVSDIVRDMCAQADGVTASLSKDFSVTDGALVACRDERLAAEIRRVAKMHGAGVSQAQRLRLAAALARSDDVERRVSERIDRTAALAAALKASGLAVQEPVGAHCVVVGVAASPAGAFTDTLCSQAGIRVLPHLGSAARRGAEPAAVRFAVPVGMPQTWVEEAARRLAAFHAPEAAQAAQPAEVARAGAPKAQALDDEIAIVGLAIRCAGADDAESFWTLLRDGVHAITEVPRERWDYREQLDARGRPTTRWGGFLRDVDAFDSLFFKISPREAELMDPQERLFLEASWSALEDAGYSPEELRRTTGGRVGVFVGCVWSLYHTLGHEEVLKGHPVAPNSFHWSIANRVSYCLDLTGPSMAVDTACSSSLTALHLACAAIERGECEAAVVGGVNLDFHPSKPRVTNIGGVLSDKGRCAAFGEGADGYVPGEGVGALIVKPLRKALEDRDHIYGVIKATEINHGGRTNGYAVPSPTGQGALVAAALARAAVDARSVSYLEAHGTGTELGDPIEVAGLTQAFGRTTADRQFCAIGSVKSNIGHLEAAAGVAGMVKVLLQFKHEQLVPTLHAASPNPGIEFEQTPFVLQRSLSPWRLDSLQARHPRRAGVSSFGAGGANAHVLLEAHAASQTRSKCADTRAETVVLSARTAQQLTDQARRVLAFLSGPGGASLRLDDIAFTLAVGRAEHDHRLAVEARDVAQLRRSLEAFLADPAASIAGVHSGVRRKRQDSAGVTPGSVNAAMWAAGAPVAWHELFQERAVLRISMPTYPFERVRHWIGSNPPVSLESDEAPIAMAQHPLLDDDGHAEDAMRFGKRLKANEFVVSDHLVAGHHTLPGVTYIEMALAASRRVRPMTAPTRLSNVTWLQPIMLPAGELDISVQLQDKGDRLAVSVCTGPIASAAPTVHAQCTVHLDVPDVTALSRKPLQERAAQLARIKPREQVYRTLLAMGMEHRAAFQVLGDLHHEAGEGLVAMALPIQLLADHGRYVLHPSLMDGALQAAAVLVTDIEDCTGTPDIPFVVKEVLVLRSPPPQCHVHVRLDVGASKGVRRFDIDIIDDDGAPCVAIRGFSVRQFKGGKPDRVVPPTAPLQTLPTDLRFYVDGWSAPVAAPVETHARPALVFDTEGQLSDADLAGLPGIVLVVPGTHGDRPGHRSRFRIQWDEPGCVEGLVSQLAAAGVELPDLLHYHVGRTEVPANDWVLAYEHVQRLGKLLDALPKLGAGQHRVLAVSCGVDPACAALVGAVRSLAQETSRVSGLTLTLAARHGLVDAIRAVRSVAALEERKSGTDEWYLDGDLQRIQRLDVTAELAGGERAGPGFADGKSYLVTGGTGAVARIVSMHLARVHHAHLTLVGRRERDADTDDWLAELRRNGGRAIYVRADVSDKSQVETAVVQAKAAHGALHGILHCAGSTDDKLLRHKTLAGMQAIAAAKVAGAHHLDDVTACDDLDLFVVFSSIASATGNIGQTDYAAANRYIDLFCASRASVRSGRSLSVRWPLWRDGGMQVDDATWAGVERRTGLRKLDSGEALRCLELALRSTHPVVGVASGQEEKLRAWLGLQDAPTLPTSPVQEDASMTRDDMSSVLDWVRSEVCQIVARLLKLKVADLDPSRDMSDYGIDSVMLTEFTNELNTRFGLELTPVAFFEYPDIEGLSGYMVEEHAAELAALAPAAKASAPAARQSVAAAAVRSAVAPATPAVAPARSTVSDEPIAVIGMHGVLPGASDLGEFWRKLMAREDMLSEVPADRFDWRKFVGDPLREINRISSKWGGFIDDIDKFDPLFFKLSPVEATFMDPQQRVFLETVWHTIEDAGYKPSALSGTRTGLFVGLATNDYIELLHATYPQVETYLTTGNAHSVLPNRISYLLNLRGPSEPVDTACSSSLVAIHRAIQSIRTGECEMALAGGVGLMMTPTTFISFSRAGMLSPEGRCKTFDKDANGYVRGEGSAAILLKPLSKAEQDGDHIYAVIRASAVNHGGYATSLTAPNPHAQAEVVVDAYRKAGVDIEAVGYIEAHGTGTPLGDPVEIAGLKKAFKTLRAEQGKTQPPVAGQCAIGSVKSNIGHLEAAAGIAGMVKVLLALQHKTLPATEHVTTLNPYIDFSGSPFALSTEVRPWEAPRNAAGTLLKRCAGVSSFGFGGVNAHVVVEEYSRATPSDESAGTEGQEQLFVLSAKTPDALNRAAANLALALREAAQRQQPGLADIAYTLQVGRDAYEHRVALKAHSADQAASLCDAFIAGRDDPRVFQGTSGPDRLTAMLGKSRAGQDFLASLVGSGELEMLALLWVSGVDVDFTRAVDAASRRRVPLPGYPFARERYWIPYEDITEAMTRQSVYSRLGHRSYEEPCGLGQAAPARASRGRQGVGHPMLDAQCAGHPGTFASFEKLFTGREYCFAEHRLHREPLMPAAGFVDMAVAPLRALHPQRSAGLEVTDVVWRRPLRCGADRGQRVVVDLCGSRDAFDFVVRDGDAPAESEPGWYSSGRVRLLEAEEARNLLAQATGSAPMPAPEACTVVREASAIYGSFEAIGLQYGVSFRSVVQLSGNDEEAHGIVELPQCQNDDFDAYILHPSLIDGALQCIDGLTVDGDFDPDRLSLPYSIERLALFAPLPRRLLVQVSLRPGAGGSGIKVFDIRLHDVNQVLLAVITGFAVRAIRRADAMSAVTSSPQAAPVLAATVHSSSHGAAPASTPASLQDRAERELVRLVAQALKLPEQRIGVELPFERFGIDSLSINRLSDSLERVFGPLPKTLFFEHSNLRSLAAYFAQRFPDALMPAPAPAPKAAAVKEAMPVASSSPVAAHPVEEPVLQRVVRLVAEALKLPAERIELDAGFERYGIDSLAISRLTERLEAQFGALPKTLFFEHANLRQLAAYLAGRAVPAVAVAAVQAPQAQGRDDDIAIIGISGRYPQADDLFEYWDNLRSGRDCIEAVPTSRWGDAAGSDTAARRFGGFVRHVDCFDSLFFGISPREARTMDPNERLFLETAWAAVEDAGYRAEDLGKQSVDEAQDANSVGVFVGAMWGQYAHHGVEQWLSGSHALTTSTYWSIANRVSYVMNFQGPSMAIDTACSSSLTAIHMACESLKRRECRAALAGGVNLTIHPIKHEDLANAGFLSSDGRCRSFGEGGDGYVPGEGVGAVVLKRLADALHDGDHVHAVIRGSSVNHGGRTHGFSVPSPVAQGRLIGAAIRRAGVAPDTIGYVEAHGTGTSLGDPIEIVGLTRAFTAAGVPLSGCIVGSVKSNIGHLEAAAGIAALTKVVLQLQHGEIVPSLHSQRLNPNIDFSGAPIRVVQQLTPWSRMPSPAAPRRAGISSFGAGGSNAHLVVEEITQHEVGAAGAAARPEVFVFSARDEAGLRQLVERFIDYLGRTDLDPLRVNLDRIAHTLQTGRRVCEHRLAVVASSRQALRDSLQGYLARGADGTQVFGGVVEQDDPSNACEERDLHRLASAWVGGADVRWAELRLGPVPMRASLPTYAFQRRRHWVGDSTQFLYVKGAAEALPAVAPIRAEPVTAPMAAPVLTCVPIWQPQPIVSVGKPDDSDAWLLLCDDAAVESAFREALSEAGVQGGRLVVVHRADGLASQAGGAPRAVAGDCDSFDALLATLRRQGAMPTRVVNCWNLHLGAFEPLGRGRDRLAALANAQRAGVQTMFAVTKAWLKNGMPELATLVEAALGTDGAFDPIHAASVGYARGLEREDPRLRAKLVTSAAGADLRGLCRQLVTESLVRTPGECCVRYRHGQRDVERYMERTSALGSTTSPAMAEPGVVLITGAFGGIGRLLAEHWASRDRTLVLVGRSAPDSQTLGWIEGLRSKCRDVVHAAADCCDVQAMEDLVERVRTSCGRITGVVHAAGVLHDGYVFGKRPEDFARVLAPKVAGTVALDHATRAEPLSFFIVLSSMVAAVGNEAQSDYCAGNAFADAYAAARSTWVAAGSRRGHSVALGLPLWRSGGMRVDEATLARLHARFGLQALDSATGLQLLDAAAAGSPPRVLVLCGDVPQLKKQFDVIDAPALPHPAVEAAPPSALEQTASAWWAARGQNGRLNPGQLPIAQASELCALLHERHGVPLQASDLSRCASAAELAQRVAVRSQGRRGLVESILDRLDRQDIAPEAAASLLAACTE